MSLLPFHLSPTKLTPTTHPGGFIKLASSNPFAAPTIDPNFLSTPFDIFTLKEAVKAVKRLLTAQAWDGYVIGPIPALAATTTDAALEAYVRANAGTVYHPVGTAAMSPKGAKWGVVDPDLKVKGVEGLRVIDASILVSALLCEIGVGVDGHVWGSRLRRMRIRKDQLTLWLRGVRI